MTIIRAPRPKAHFTTVRNDVLRGVTNARALGILVYLLSHADNYRCNVDDLANHFKEGREAIATAMRDLRELGFIEQQRTQNEHGRWVVITTVYDTPRTSLDVPTPTPAAATPSEASKIVAEVWEPRTTGVTAQPAVAVVRIVAGALKNGIPADRLRTALTTIANSKQTVTIARLNEALNGGAPIRGQLAADKTDWSAVPVPTDGVMPF